jgi:hypothetical protein
VTQFLDDATHVVFATRDRASVRRVTRPAAPAVETWIGYGVT